MLLLHYFLYTFTYLTINNIIILFLLVEYNILLLKWVVLFKNILLLVDIIQKKILKTSRDFFKTEYKDDSCT